MDKTIGQYQNIIAEAREVFTLKTRDYGTAWRILRVSSLTDQIFIKASRIRSIQEKREMQIDDSIENEFLGIINYCIMALIQLEIGPAEGDHRIDEGRLFKLYDKHAAATMALMEKKNHDYGEAWRDMRISSMTDLILMKLLRVKQIEENKGKTLISEGLEANYQDMLNYAVFALIKKSEKAESQ